MIHDVKILSGEHYNITGGVCNIGGTNYNIVQGYTPISESGTLVMKDILFGNSGQSLSIIDSSSLTSDTLVKGSIQLGALNSNITTINWKIVADERLTRYSCFQSPNTSDSVSNMQTGLWTAKQYDLSNYNNLFIRFYRPHVQGRYSVYIFLSTVGDSSHTPSFLWYGGDITNASMSSGGILLKKYISSGSVEGFEQLTPYWTNVNIDISSYSSTYSIGIASVCDPDVSGVLMTGICLADLSLS